MSRTYQCPTCLKPATTQSQRGPTPKRCTDCTGVPEPTGEVTYLPGVPNVLRIARRDTVETVLYQDKMALALAMRVGYAEWAEIAAACGYKTEQAAYLAVKQETAKRQLALDEPLDHIRVRELARLDRMSAAAQKVLDTDHYLVSAGRIVHHGPEGEEQPLMDDGPTLAAVDRLLKVSESRRKLLGLDAAEKVKNEVTVKYTVEGIAEGDMP